MTDPDWQCDIDLNTAFKFASGLIALGNAWQPEKLGCYLANGKNVSPSYGLYFIYNGGKWL